MYAQREDTATRDSKYVADRCRVGGCDGGGRMMWYEMRDEILYMCVYIKIAGCMASVKSEFPLCHPAPRGYRRPKAFEDRFVYKHATEYLVHSDSEDSQDTSTSEYRRTWGIPDNDEEYDNFRI